MRKVVQLLSRPGSAASFAAIAAIAAGGSLTVSYNQLEGEKRSRLISLDKEYREHVAQSLKELDRFEKEFNIPALSTKVINKDRELAEAIKKVEPHANIARSFYDRLMFLSEFNSLPRAPLYLLDFPGSSTVNRFLIAHRFWDELNFYVNFSHRPGPYDGGSDVYGWLAGEYLPLRDMTKSTRNKFKSDTGCFSRLQCRLKTSFTINSSRFIRSEATFKVNSDFSIDQFKKVFAQACDELKVLDKLSLKGLVLPDKAFLHARNERSVVEVTYNKSDNKSDKKLEVLLTVKLMSPSSLLSPQQAKSLLSKVDELLKVSSSSKTS